ncbi:hypothetical protein ACET3X_000696 [Alternaria dauci]|uniref:Transcription factor domain-containing protein n=1 Tax=Alternaria dauci TaxID=48095 RepID=A0ABR3UWZ3_9PLEO
MTTLLSVLEWIGSIYAPWTPSEPYYMTALEAVTSPDFAHTPFNVQALMLFALAEFHCDYRVEARKKLSTCTAMALELCMNERDFARAYGESDPVLEECWRRTYYILYIVDQHFAVVTNTPFYPLLLIPNTVDLPCDDEYFESGNIPPVVTWAEYQAREFAEIEVIYSSVVYLYDIAMVIAYVINYYIETAVVNEALIEYCDTKLAVWSSLLPACKKDSLRLSGQVDEVIFMAHLCAAITISAIHRPFSSLGYCPEEMTTQAFQAPSPFTLRPKAGRNAHTARVLKATEIHTKLLAIPCALEKHNIFTMCITSQLAAVQVSACTYILDGHALSIARDRVRLSIGFLNTMATLWPLGKKMVKEVRAIARSCIAGAGTQNTMAMDAGPAGSEIDLARDELVCPVDPSAQIDIYSGIVIPIDWDSTSFSYPSLTSSGLV